MLLIDSRRGLLPNDTEVMDLLDRAAVSYQLVLTKIDKLKPGELAKVESKTALRLATALRIPSFLSTSPVSGSRIAAADSPP